MDNLIADATILIDATPERIWTALTSPDEIRQYLFGTQTATDWKPGSEIRWRGEWQGKSYEDKGKVIAYQPPKLLQYTYWSSMSGKPDNPDNYNNVTTIVEREGNQTRVTVRQDGNPTPESKEHAASNWRKVLASLKQLVETRR